ncbi:putative hydro-lyase [Rhizobium leguminosarum]|uniref:putative hydro-lyase n=1 Tax=Rhizobium leguminosarum TaxID=384 RepID=UPI0004887038|nr:putative hydro-lyase [Rhizobium leguminosarum]
MNIVSTRQEQAFSNPLAMRAASRNGSWTKETSGTAPGYVQANLTILPSALADDFLRFCVRNPKACPLVGISEKGSPRIPDLGVDLDIRTDVPRYRVWEGGELAAEPTDISDLWSDDLVVFAIGCSFSFEEALIANGIGLRHVAEGHNVAMYRTNIECVPAGPFSGPMVVSMRPLAPADAIRAVQITSRMPAVHGAPIHIGLPASIGIENLDQPDYGDPTRIMPDEMPVFWACGVTPQAVIEAARPKFAITHAPGCMLVTDKPNAALIAF